MTAAQRRHPDRLMVASVLGTPARIRAFEEDGIAVFEDPGRAVAAIAAMGRFGDAFAAAAAQPMTARQALPSLPALPSGRINEAQALALLAEAGIATVSHRVCATAAEAIAAARSIGYPVVLKISSPDIAHKSDIGGVLLGVADDAAVADGFGRLLDRAREADASARVDGILVARQIRGGVECLAGIQCDPAFGPIAVFGLGGVLVEVLDDVALRRCPFDETVALRLIRSIRGAALLDGARGRAPADLPALARLLARLSWFAVAAGPRLRSIDLNPVLALPDGAVAVDAVIEFS